MLSPQSWLHLAEGLDIGRKRRHDHDCGPGKTLLISRDDRGYSSYCWRCSDHGFAPGPQESLADKLARLARLRAADKELAPVIGNGGRSDVASTLPGPTTYDVDSWPASAALWFYRAGLSRHDIGALGAYYHAPSGRCVLPVFGAEDRRDGTEQGPGQAEELVVRVPLYWQARTLDGRFPKYIGASFRPPSMIARWGSAPSPTLCEDILSAYKVGLVGEGWAVMGTSVPSAYIAELLKRQVRVNIWLDPDAAGRRAANKYKRQLQAYGLEVNDIRSTLDPKKHTLGQIKEYVNG